MRTFISALIVVLNSLPGTAYAESTADLLKNFGLMGKWSINCMRAPENYDAANRITVERSSFGNPIVSGTYRNPGNNPVVSVTSEVVEVTQTGEQRLQIKTRRFKTTVDEHAYDHQSTGKLDQTIVTKQADVKIMWNDQTFQKCPD